MRALLCGLLLLVDIYRQTEGATSSSLISFTTYPEQTATGCLSLGYDYFDPSSYTCKTCSADQEPLTTVADGSGNYVECHCDSGFVSKTNDCTQDTSGSCSGLSCTSCYSQGLAAYSDRSACVSCDDNTQGLSTSTFDCACATGYALVETDAVGNKLSQKTCLACPSGTAVVASDTNIAGKSYTGSLYTCQSCPDSLMSMSTSLTCTCPSGYTTVGVTSIGQQSCILTSKAAAYIALEASASNVNFYGSTTKQTVVSNTFLHYFVKAAANCAAYGGPQNNADCQALANLCVLQLYDDQTNACAKYMSIVADRGTSYTNDVLNWVAGMPWLYYSGPADSICFDEAMKMRMRLGGVTQSQNKVLTYVLSVFTMNGTWVGFQELNTLFYYCSRPAPNSDQGGGDSSSTKWQYFGATIESNFTCDVSTLLAQEQLFYELFIYDTNTFEYYPVPVRIVNQRSGSSGNRPNTLRPGYLCDSSDLFVRRFFLFDRVSGISESTGSTPAVIRHASYIVLETSIQSVVGAYIYPPVLTIEYNETLTYSSQEFNLVKYYVQGRYTMDLTKFKSTLNGFFIGGIVLCGLLVLLRIQNWRLRNTRAILTATTTTDLGGINVDVISQMCLMVMHTGVMFFFPFTLMICWYFFVFYKLQSYPDVLMPAADSIYNYASPYFYFTCIIHILAIFQLVYVCVLVYKQSNADIFLIDWEPAKNKSTIVSVWRTVLVANEWAEMQTMRKTDIRFTLFFMVLILIGRNYDNNATLIPAVKDLSSGTLNPVLRFAQTTFWWLILSLGQYLWKFLIYERYISEPPEQVFVDFCTIAKVSVLVLDEPYHGYYLHCRSPHQYADGSMVELVEMLHKEEAGLTVDRSLEGAPTDVQSFEIFVTGEWRSAFNKMYSTLVTAPTFSEIMQKARNHRGPLRNEALRNAQGADSRRAAATGRASTEKLLKAWKELAVFLQQFVENNFGKSNLRRIVRDATYAEKFLGFPPDVSTMEQPSVFFTDRHFEYCKVMFLGREGDLLLLNILSYSLFDVWFGSTAISALCCYLLDYAISFVRDGWGKAVIAKKTLVDERFLM